MKSPNTSFEYYCRDCGWKGFEKDIAWKKNDDGDFESRCPKCGEWAYENQFYAKEEGQSQCN
jgi:predicted RNA-binding Zn-ribbon protein involved in translation (DUF1610 family)